MRYEYHDIRVEDEADELNALGWEGLQEVGIRAERMSDNTRVNMTRQELDRRNAADREAKRIVSKFPDVEQLWAAPAL